MGFEHWSEAFIFIFVFLLLIAVPCVGMILIGYKFISELGYFPSKTPEIQMSICLKFCILFAVSVLGFVVFLKLFS